eukprot:CAMPEP_0196772590 /NCGR_PEP_ID=MMETSP1104-20130614/2315_1 /TAXON_ID=33652 /ORGANISM="Cafeteria sp., Strain Caron Lab Isolate" /LENGTH=301 /DNA_ID=CAMNT_0042142727 /DNA_START=41 /DNA_END=943 /DNA_ORIENTATION=+
MGNEKSRQQRASTEEEAVAAVKGEAVPHRGEELTPEDFALDMLGHHGLPPGCCRMAFDPVHRLLAVGTMEGTVKVFGSEGVEVLLRSRREGERPSAVTFLVFLPSQYRLVVVFANSAVHIYDLSTCLQVARLDATWTTCRVTAVTFLEHSKHQYLYMATDDGVVHVVNARNLYLINYQITPRDIGIPEVDAVTSEPPSVTALAVNPSNEGQLLVGFEFSGLHLWDLVKRKVVRSYTLPTRPGTDPAAEDASGADPSPGALRCVAWHGGGGQFAAGFEAGFVCVWRADRKAGEAQFTDASRP